MLKVFCYMIKLSCIMADLIDIFFRFETDNGKLRLISIEIDMSILSMVVFCFIYFVGQLNGANYIVLLYIRRKD